MAGDIMQNSKYNPASFQEYSAKDLNVNLTGHKFVAAANTPTSCDFVVTDDYLIDGAEINVINSNIGDTITAQVIDKDNVMGYGANLVLRQFVTDWYVNPSTTQQIEYTSRYPAKIFAGLYLRIIYKSTHESTPADVIVNYNLHKVLW
jgi:hypothetical protein